VLRLEFKHSQEFDRRALKKPSSQGWAFQITTVAV